MLRIFTLLKSFHDWKLLISSFPVTTLLHAKSSLLEETNISSQRETAFFNLQRIEGNQVTKLKVLYANHSHFISNKKLQHCRPLKLQFIVTVQMQNAAFISRRNATSPSPSYSTSSMSSHRTSPPASQSVISNESDSPPNVASPPNSPTSPMLRVSRRMLPETPKMSMMTSRDVKSFDKGCRQRSKFFSELSSRDSLDSGVFSRSTTCDSTGLPPGEIFN